MTCFSAAFSAGTDFAKHFVAARIAPLDAGKSIYGCTVLAIDAQGKNIETIEGLPQNNPISNAFVNNDAQQCGYCTPGFVMAAKGFLAEHPNPTMEDVKHGLGGNLCRCGTYMGIRAAVMQAANQQKGGRRNG